MSRGGAAVRGAALIAPLLALPACWRSAPPQVEADDAWPPAPVTELAPVIAQDAADPGRADDQVGVVRGGVGRAGGGVVSGIASGSGASPVATPSRPTVSMVDLEQRRLGGPTSIAPPATVIAAAAAAGTTRLVARFAFCVGTTGAVTTVTRIATSGYPDYDDVLRAAIETWTFQPVLDGGTPIEACTTFAFNVKLSP